jgi:mRNA interferase YafQ
LLQIDQTKSFKKHLKRYRHRKDVRDDLEKVLELLVQQQPLPAKYKDHLLQGSFLGYTNVRELHLRPEDLLVYFIQEHDSLTLVALGSHAQLF